MVLLGRWQLDVSNAKHFSLQNFGYAVQWWAFTVFAVFLWVRLLRDAANARITATLGDSSSTPSTGSADPSPSADPTPSADATPGYRRYVMPSVADATPTDDVHAAYNAYLAGLSGDSTPDPPTDVPSTSHRQRGAAGQSAR
jgi:DNA-binding transcriptional regulator of glucitol operon